MGIEGLRAFVGRHGLTQVGARRFEGVITRGRVPVTTATSLELRSGQLEAKVRVSPPTPQAGLMGCARAHWLGPTQLPAPTPTGDTALDDAVVLVVPDVTLLGLFDGATRAELGLALASGEVVLEDGVFLATFVPELNTDEALDQACERLVALAHILSVPKKDWLERTLTLATRDLDPRVRAQLVSHLEARPELHAELELHRMKSDKASPGDADLHTLLAVLASPSLEPPSRAAALPSLLSHLSMTEVVECARSERGLWSALSHYGGGEGFDTLMLELEKRLTPDIMKAEPDAVLELLEHLWPFAKRSRLQTALPFTNLLRKLGHPGALDMVALLLDTKDQQRFFPALDALTTLTDDPEVIASRLGERGRSRLGSWIRPYLATRKKAATDLPLLTLALAELSEVHEHLEDTLGVLDLLAERMGAEAEPDLLSYLDHADDTLVYRAIDLLGQVGGREAQAALEPLTAGLFRPSELKRIARTSLARLHERLGPLTTGGLSLTASEDGGLALTTDTQHLDDRDA